MLGEEHRVDDMRGVVGGDRVEQPVERCEHDRVHDPEEADVLRRAAPGEGTPFPRCGARSSCRAARRSGPSTPSPGRAETRAAPLRRRRSLRVRAGALSALDHFDSGRGGRVVVRQDVACPLARLPGRTAGSRIPRGARTASARRAGTGGCSGGSSGRPRSRAPARRAAPRGTRPSSGSSSATEATPFRRMPPAPLEVDEQQADVRVDERVAAIRYIPFPS